MKYVNAIHNKHLIENIKNEYINGPENIKNEYIDGPKNKHMKQATNKPINISFQFFFQGSMASSMAAKIPNMINKIISANMRNVIKSARLPNIG